MSNGFNPTCTWTPTLSQYTTCDASLLLQATYGLPTSTLGGILFGANVIGGLSSLASGWVANRFGLIRTMVFT